MGNVVARELLVMTAMRLIVTALPIVAMSSAFAVAEPPPDDASVTHVLDSSYDLSASAGYTAGTLLTASAGGDLDYRATIRDAYVIDVGGGATLSRMEGIVNATGLTTRLHAHLGPEVTLGVDRAAWAPMPLTFEIDHEGAIASLPRLSSRADVSRNPFTSEQVDVHTRVARIGFGGVDNRPQTPPDQRGPYAGALDMFPVHAEMTATIQDGTRLEESIGLYALGLDVTAPVSTHLDFFGIAYNGVQLADGTTRDWAVPWLLRADASRSQSSPPVFIGFGLLQEGFITPRRHGIIHLFEMGAQVSTRVPMIVSFRERPYITMDGAGALEGRLSLELPFDAHEIHWTARTFAARTERQDKDLTPRIDWTAGVEVDANRRVGPFDVGAIAEVGRSFYAELDGASPMVGVAARGGLTIARRGKHTVARSRRAH